MHTQEQQGGMVIIQPSGAIAMPQGYPPAGQQPVYFPQQHVPMQQPAYWAVPSGSNPAGTVAMPYAGATGQGHVQLATKDQDRPPPYSYMQTGNAPPSASSGGAPSEAVTVDM
ncbi:hypothetical protein OS493_019543 [Desmophyllum pertusum]|uniref:Uncharacterized protein n=1 Tax=Desmophyllum pertusum TaxID=174260 RepID=A0A9W9ZP28_9CNID|nr:hypothetical protein OS493_019543 [Desmophyllum pertusum]